MLDLFAGLGCTYNWNLDESAMYSVEAFVDSLLVILLPIIRINDRYTKKNILKKLGFY